MNVLVDTPIWSLALRRQRSTLSMDEQLRVDQWKTLVMEDRAALIGPIRQELLSGIRHETDFENLREVLSSFEEVPIVREDYVQAARFFNLCRSKGISASSVDALICAVAARVGLVVFTADADFERYAEVIPIRLFDLRTVTR